MSSYGVRRKELREMKEATVQWMENAGRGMIAKRRKGRRM